jgi:glycosyltransferase involved in cell wall biosynthesis
MTDATVIICTYNRAGLLREALRALGAQRTVADLQWDILVADNNSADNTKDVVHDFQSVAPVPVTYLFEGRQGKSFALNSAVEAAQGKILAFTDDDCRPEPSWVQDSVNTLTRWKADGVGGRILPNWSAPPPSWLALDRHLWTSLAILDDNEVRRVELGPWQRANGFRVWGANMSFRRTAFEAVGGFDSMLGGQGKRRYSHEDVEFVRRVVEAGRTVMFDPTPTVWHWVGPERMRKSYFRTHSFYYGEGSAFKSGPPRGRHVLGIPPYLLRNLGGHVARWIGAALRRDPETFCCEREIHESIGYLSGYMKCALQAGEYARIRASRPLTPGSQQRLDR